MRLPEELDKAIWWKDCFCYVIISEFKNKNNCLIIRSEYFPFLWEILKKPSFSTSYLIIIAWSGGYQPVVPLATLKAPTQDDVDAH